MAWLVTAFYATGIITFGFILAYAPLNIRILATCAVVITSILVWLFANMQFYRRWESAIIQIGLMRFASNLCCNSVTLPSEPAYTLDKEKRFPDHIWQYIGEVFDDKPRGKWKATKGIFQRHNDWWRTELPSYGLITIATVIAIVALWAF